MRQRQIGQTESDDEDEQVHEGQFLLSMSEFKKGSTNIPSAIDLLSDDDGNAINADAFKSGFLMKRSWRYHGMLKCIPCCGLDKPVYKKRLFILRGGYLFRYVDRNSERPKGVPVPIEDATFHTLSDEEEDSNCLFLIRTIRKEYHLRATTRAKRDEWIKKLKGAKQLFIKMRMGHMPISKDDAKITKAGDDLFSLRLKRERDDAKRIEEKFIGGGGGLSGAGMY